MPSNNSGLLILGAGMTGLAASAATGALALEAEETPGGICRSYETEGPSGRWRFDVGGGHWVFGGDPMLNVFLDRFARWRAYARKSSVYLPQLDRLVPYPIQYNLHALPTDLRNRIWEEMKAAPRHRSPELAAWLSQTFGSVLNGLFFGPFHDLYTAGLTATVAAADFFKTPVHLAEVERGLRGEAMEAGYNQRFLYPEEGLSRFAEALSREANVACGQRVVRIDLARKQVESAAGERFSYERLLSTLPLHQTLSLAGMSAGATDPFTSVLVLNIGARRGSRCPEDHWVYVPRSEAGFHRAGFYSNVDCRFVPEGRSDLTGLYVERAFQPDARAEPDYEKKVVAELQRWGWIEEAETVTPHWIEVAYTWRRTGSRWCEEAAELLARNGIFLAGRYARWRFQGIADSLREGLQAGQLLAGRS